MTTEKVLADFQIFDCFDRQCSEMVINFDAEELYQVGRAIEQAVLNSEQVQAWKQMTNKNSKQEYAARAMQGILSDHENNNLLMDSSLRRGITFAEAVAIQAFSIAEAMESQL